MQKKTGIFLIAIMLISLSTPLAIISAQTNLQLLDNLQVPSDGSHITSNFSLQNGVSYQIAVSGTYFTAKSDLTQNNQQDAMYATHDKWATYDSTPNGLYIDSWSVGTKQWGSYNTDNSYQYTLVGNGSKVSFWIYSTSYDQNSGSLTVQILGLIGQGTPTPTPTTSTTASPTPTPSTSTTPTASTSPTSSSTPNTSPTMTPTNKPSTSPTNSPIPAASTTATPSTTQTANSSFENTAGIATAIIASVIIVASIFIVLSRKKKN